MIRHMLHLRSPGNWINDPNGFLYYRGLYHLFYQHFPYEPRWGTMHWGHAVSRDLVTWEHRGIALYPSKYWDQNGCFSGSAMENEGAMFLYYTGVRYEVVSPEDIHRSIDEKFEASQLMLVSPDGVRFDNTQKRVIIPPITDPATGDRRHTRDPKVWRGADGRFHMVLGTTVNGCGRLLFYESSDGLTWTYQNCCTGKSAALGHMWECPDLFFVDGAWVLCMSPIGFQWEGKAVQQSVCAVVEFEETSAALTLPQDFSLIDYGGDLYAPQTATDSEGRRTMIAWMRMPRPVDAETPWSGLMCAPRLVEVRGGRAAFPMHPNVRAAFQKPVPSDAPFEAGVPCLFELRLREGESVSIGGYRIALRGGCICTDRSGVCERVDGLTMQAKTAELGEAVQLEILTDENIIEIYVNHGACVLSQVLYEWQSGLTFPAQTDVRRWEMEQPV